MPPKSCTLIYTGRGLNAIHPQHYNSSIPPTFSLSDNDGKQAQGSDAYNLQDLSLLNQIGKTQEKNGIKKSATYQRDYMHTLV